VTRPPVVQEIYERRIRLDYSIREAARRAGISEGSWRRTESDRKLKRTDETIARMAAAVGMTEDDLTARGWPAAAQILATLRAPAPEPVTREDELMREIRATRQEFRDYAVRADEKLDRALRALRDRESRDDSKEDETHERRAV
jgi:transcriptional regulator with XRE-family HTH domain